MELFWFLTNKLNLVIVVIGIVTIVLTPFTALSEKCLNAYLRVLVYLRILRR